MSEDFSKATPRPWHFDGEAIWDSNGFVIVDYSDLMGNVEERQANARLIVAAVNAYRESSEADVERLGDWIITGVKGEHYPCKPDIFAQTYEPVEAEVTQPTDDDARLAEIRLLLTERPGRKLPPDTNKMRFLLRLLDEARVERDALAAKLTKAISLIKDVRDNGLIYWEPNTSRGAANRALMFRSINETIAALDDTGGPR